MILISVLFILAALFEIILPLAIARWSTRKFLVSWRLFFIGMLTFFGSQVVHIPVLQILTRLFQNGTLPQPPLQYTLVFNAVLLGLLAGLFEETARLIAFLVLKKRANSFGAALTMGAGHGGLESILIGLYLLVNLGMFIIISLNGPDALPFLGSMGQTVHSQLPAYWSQPWYMPLLSAFERLTAVSAHITLSVLVWQAVARRNAWWFIGAILWHAVIDFVAVFGVGAGWSAPAIEAVLGVFMLVNLALLYAMRRWTKGQAAAPIPAVEPGN
ncbi:MAG TPA: YhfC family glutamic-type intramembrane protease [Anaerolineales bacterium]